CRFLRRARKPMRPRPPAKSGNAAGMGVADTSASAVPLTWTFVPSKKSSLVVRTALRTFVPERKSPLEPETENAFSTPQLNPSIASVEMMWPFSSRTPVSSMAQAPERKAVDGLRPAKLNVVEKLTGGPPLEELAVLSTIHELEVESATQGGAPLKKSTPGLFATRPCPVAGTLLV